MAQIWHSLVKPVCDQTSHKSIAVVPIKLLQSGRASLCPRLHKCVALWLLCKPCHSVPNQSSLQRIGATDGDRFSTGVRATLKQRLALGSCSVVPGSSVPTQRASRGRVFRFFDTNSQTQIPRLTTAEKRGILQKVALEFLSLKPKCTMSRPPIFYGSSASFLAIVLK